MKAIGQQAEAAALRFLQQQGLELMVRNWACKGGELDLIMRDGSYWVFVEVRHRTHSSFGGAAYSITPKKQQRLAYAAQCYLTLHNIDAPCRFDAILSSKNQPLEWLQNIF